MGTSTDWFTVETGEAPQDALEVQLRGIWERVLGVQGIRRGDNFFELGGHSLLAASLFAQIEKTFHRSLPLATIFQAQTLAEMAGLLREHGWASQWSSLVPIQPEGQRPVLFCVHAQSGQTLFYRDLARHLGSDQPLYGLQSAGLDGSRQPLEDVESMAARYIEELRTLQPQGPYFLGGFCLGAYVAFEMARQLQARDEKVALLAIFDTDGGWKKVTSLLEGVRYHRRRMSGLNLRAKSAYVLGRIRFRMTRLGYALAEMICKFWIGTGYPLPRSLRGLNVFQRNFRANHAYLPQAYSGKIVYFQGQDGLRKDPELLWKALAAGGLEVCQVPGKGTRLFREPNVRILAEALRNRLEQARQ